RVMEADFLGARFEVRTRRGDFAPHSPPPPPCPAPAWPKPPKEALSCPEADDDEPECPEDPEDPDQLPLSPCPPEPPELWQGGSSGLEPSRGAQFSRRCCDCAAAKTPIAVAPRSPSVIASVRI